MLALLAEKHSADVFVPECKDGPSAGSTHFRMDAWVMKRSWSHPLTIGYEIKASRPDFLRDDKWQAYLPCCNEFYFVCPSGVMTVDELPPEIGLIHTAATGTRLFIKRKARYRQVEIPEDVWRYILMCRAVINRYAWEVVTKKDTRESWRAWLAQRSEDRDLGQCVSKAVEQTISDRIEKVQQENGRLQSQMQQYGRIRDLLRGIGVDEDHPGEWMVQDRIEELKSAVPKKLLRTLERSIEVMNSFREELEKLKQAPTVQARGAA